MIIDAHQHVWQLGRSAYEWLTPELAPLNRSIGMDEALPELRAAGVAGTVLVQADDTDSDTDAMVDAAARYAEVVGVVGWLALDDPARARARWESLRAEHRGLIVGVRTLLHDGRPSGWILDDTVAPALTMLGRDGATFDVVMAHPGRLTEVPQLAARHPDLRIVIDHLGKPPVGGDDDARREWRLLLAHAAALPNVFAKVSGLYSTTGAVDDWTIEQVRPFTDDALDLFGAQRLMYGSDWPVSLLAGGYHRTWQAISSIADALSPDESAAFLGGTAQRVYRLDPTRMDAANATSIARSDPR